MAQLRQIVRKLWRVAAWPSILIASLALVDVLRRGGLSDSSVVLALSTAVGLFLLGVQQRTGQHQTGQHQTGQHQTQGSRPDAQTIGTDLLHMGLSNGLVTAGIRAVAFSGLAWLSTQQALQLGLQLWPERWPLGLQVALAMVLGELVFTSVHRLAHRVSWMWPWHAVHHSSAVLYVLAAGRNHPVNTAVSYIAQLFPALLLGASGDVLLYLGLFTSVHGMLQHADLGLTTGPLSWVFATPEVHRVHHSVDAAEGNSNFGSNLVVWDMVFGTWRAPRSRPSAVGLAHDLVPRGYWQQLRAPFRWQRLARQG